MAVTRCTVVPEDGTQGFGYVAGTVRRHAELGAVRDAMMLSGKERKTLEERLWHPSPKPVPSVAKFAATRVDFFTVVRGKKPQSTVLMRPRIANSYPPDLPILYSALSQSFAMYQRLKKQVVGVRAAQGGLVVTADYSGSACLAQRLPERVQVQNSFRIHGSRPDR